MEAKIKSKIQKLLALAQSDNPHEALRARTQAHAMMRKHNLSENEIEIVEVEGYTFNRKNIRDSEAILVNAIASITGTYSFKRTMAAYHNGVKWHQSKIIYVGDKAAAELASYSLEVLVRQMEKAARDLKKEHPELNGAELSRFKAAYATTASRKVVEIMGTRELSEDVQEWVGKQKMTVTKSRASKPQGSLEAALLSKGFKAGEQAQLHVAANDNREKREALPNLG